MPVHVDHNPRTKQEIKLALLDKLYGPVYEGFFERLNSLTIKNCVLTKSSHRSFTFRGVTYNCDTTSPPKPVNRLVLELMPIMLSYVQEQTELNDRELPYVTGFITQVLNSSNHFEDYKRLLPDAIHSVLQEFIDVCPCRQNEITQEKISEIHKHNKEGLAMMKRRLAINLIT